MMIVKAKFLGADGAPRGREYTYGCNDSAGVGEVAYTEDGKELVITAVDLPEETGAQWGAGLKFLFTAQPEAAQQAMDLDKAAGHELITIKQLPVIIERLSALGERIDGDVQRALALECSNETVKAVKSLRAQLNSDFALLEDRRKAVKKAIMEPYEQFEAAYKQHVTDKYRPADVKLKDRVAGVEDEIKQKKREELKAYFDEYRLSRGVDFADMDAWNPNITLSASLKSLKAESKAFVDRIRDDLDMIDTQADRAEIMVEYRRSLNAARAIAVVAERHRAVELQKQRQEEQAAIKAAAMQAAERAKEAMAAAAPPAVIAPAFSPQPPQEDDPVRRLAFTVTAPISKLRLLKKFLDDGGYEYE